MIKRFRINKLFGFRNVNIPFDNNIKILIGENGLGKTTVLNSLYYVLTEKYNKLIQIDFERVELQFFDDSKIQFTKRELEIYIDYQRRNTKRHIPNKILETVNLEELESIIGDNEFGNRETERIIAKYIASKRIPRWAPTNIMARELYILVKEPIVKKFLGFKDIIGKFSTTILYFPTYRRVEEDLKNLGKFRKRYIDPDFEQDLFEEIDEEIEISEDTLIHFGMEDVIQRIDNVKEQINKSTVEGFSKVTGEILSQLLKGFPELNDDEIEELDVQTAKIVLHRVGDNLSQNDRNSILELLDKPKDLVEKKELTYFLLNLIEIYNQHKHIDDSIKKFRDVCNEYLEDKEFRYNESNVDIDVYRSGTDEKVSLNKLSSGEKQIISLFSKIYLESSKNYIVLFDEPELSLSIEWQKLLLPHIVSSEKCKFLLSVTHSPFIFKNELVDYAVGMSAYIK